MRSRWSAALPPSVPVVVGPPYLLLVPSRNARGATGTAVGLTHSYRTDCSRKKHLPESDGSQDTTVRSRCMLRYLREYAFARPGAAPPEYAALARSRITRLPPLRDVVMNVPSSRRRGTEE